jgi:hypothetical protein
MREIGGLRVPAADSRWLALFLAIWFAGRFTVS